MICLSFLTGCDLFSEKDYDEVWTDSDGNVYYIINDNHIDFSENNVLEIVKANTTIYNRVYTLNTTEEELATFETKAEAEKLLSEIKDNKIMDSSTHLRC